MTTTLGVAVLVAYLLAIPLLLKLVARNGRPGLLRRSGHIEAAMLIHIAMLLAGGVLVLGGLTGEF
ncbi:hypothetical protein EDC65_4778 [Stella humosa]|uniref:Uncharacterized protein n=1 Tax=Stella humosa TaxID=94 RepID=A0A3N1L158_9PROT|nr:hypothetical protein [Stella humosa]ROP83245.1 hypothetical protein EDC65_4778 [Stella humosa]BBK29973.1 hypothetical protein STHU_06070 [Stella humosa]